VLGRFHVSDPLLVDLHLLVVPFLVEQLVNYRLGSVHFILNTFKYLTNIIN